MFALDSCSGGSRDVGQHGPGAGELDALTEAFTGLRPFEPRVSAMSTWVAYEEAGGAPPIGTPRSDALVEAANNIREAVRADPTPAHRHAEAVVRLVWWRTEGAADRAVKALESLVRTDESADLWADLAAAYLVRAEFLQRPEDLPAALEAGARAVRLDPTHQAGGFNRALALTRLHLAGEAEEAWRAFLALDPGDGWAREASDRLAELGQGTVVERWAAAQGEIREALAGRDHDTVRVLVGELRQPARLWIEHELLGEWGEAVLAGDEATAARSLELAAAVGAALAEAGGDPLAAETTAYLQGELRDRAAVATAFRRFAAAQEPLGRGDVEVARPLVAPSRAALRGSPFAPWIDFYLLVCDFYSRPYPETLPRIRRFRSSRDPSRTPALLGRTLWLEGLAHSRMRQFTESIDVERRALEIFEALAERENVAFVNSLLAENLQFLGATSAAWRHRIKALRGLSDLQTQRRANNFLFDATAAATSARHDEAALHFENEMVRVSERIEHPIVTFEAHRLRAMTLTELGRAADAERDLRAVESRLNDVPDVLRARAAADISRTRAEVLAATDPGSAVAHFTRAVEQARGSDFQLYLPFLLHGRARARLATGDVEEAVADLEEGIRAFERDRSENVDPMLQLWLFQQAQELFDEMIVLQLGELNRPEVALDYAERSRSSWLVDQGAERSQFPEDAVATTLPADARLVFYALLEKELIVWVAGRQGIHVRRMPGGLAVLENLARGAFGSEPQPNSQTALEALYSVLIEPVRELLVPGGLLVLVPDKALHVLPFAALRNRDSGQFLIEEHPLVLAPSAGAYMRAREELDRRSGGEPVLALVADPAFDRRLFPALPRLPGAVAEAKSIGSLYPTTRLWTGPEATFAALRSGLRGATLAHLAAHALADAGTPFSGQILLSGADRLDSATIRDLPLDSVRTVILSACSTQSGPVFEGEGVLGLVRPFLQSGVAHVVASLWEVDDRATAFLMTEFHRNLRDLSVSEALRQAQIASLGHQEASIARSEVWAAFQVHGAD